MKAAIVGCGFIARKHLAALRRLKNVEITGVCDRNLQLAQQVAHAHGIDRAFDDIDRLLDQTAPDVLHVLTPPQSHHALVLQAFAAGCHVLVEKPMALSAAEAEDMITAARRADRQLSVCHNYLFVPAFAQARRLIAQGALGQALSAEIYWRMSTYGPGEREHASGWMRELPGGVFQEVLPHLVYSLAAVMGSLRVVAVESGGRHDGIDSELHIMFAGERGPATLALSLRSNPVLKCLRIYGTESTLQVDLATSMLQRLRARSDGIVDRAMVAVSQATQLAGGTIGNTVRLLCRRLPRSHDLLIADFYGALARGNTPAVTGEDGAATLAVLDPVWQALQEVSTDPQKSLQSLSES